MNKENNRGAADNGAYSHTHIYDSHSTTAYTYHFQKASTDMKGNYEKELGNHIHMMQASMAGGKRSKMNKRNSTRTMLASFLIGAVVIGGLSYMADKNNMFSGGDQVENSTNTNIASNSAQSEAGLIT